MGGEQGSDTIGRKPESKERVGQGWGNGKGLCAQQTKLHGLLIIKMGGCTSGGEHDFKWYIDTLLDKTDSHNEKIHSLFKSVLFLGYNKRGSLSLVQVCLYGLWVLSWS